MFNTSLDILYLCLSIFVASITIILIFFAVKFYKILSKVNQILEEIAKIGKVVGMMKEKLEHSASHLGLIADMVGKVVMHFIENKLDGKIKKRK